ncbi:MAG: major capsid protein [bacterium]
MATVQNNRLGIVEIAKRTNNGNVLTISEVLSRTDEIFMDMQWVPCNQVAAHVHSRRLSAPSGTWRKIGTGATVETSHVRQIVENCGTLESWAEVDELTIKSLIGDKQKFLNTEFVSFVEGLGQTMTTAFVSADTQTNPEQFDGVLIRTNALGTYVKGCGGSGSDTTSVYFIQWGEDAVHGIYQPDLARPTDSAPVAMDNKGLQTAEDASTTARRDVFRAKFQASMGLAVHDDRNLCRLTNIEDDPSGANIFEPDLAVQLLNSMKNRGRGATMYAHQITLTQLDILAMDKGNVLYSIGTLWGEPVTMFRTNIPIRQLDAIGITETVVA